MTTQIRTASITVSRAALYQQLTEAKRIVDPKITAPILRTVLLTIANGALSVAATDMRLNVLGQVAAVSQTGEIGLSCGIDAKKLHDVVKALPGDVTLEIVERSGTERREGGGAVRWCKVCDGQVALTPGYQPKFCPKKGCTASALVDFKMVSSFDVTSTLSSGKSRFNLLSLSGSAFPKMPDTDTLAKLDWQTLSAETLAELIDGTLFSASLDATREHLYACLLESKAGHLRMVSTDGHRLSRIDRVGELKLAQPLCIPRDGIVELRKLCSAKVRNVDLAVSGMTLYFRASGQTLTTYSTILSTAQFPPYEQVIPRYSARSISVEVAALTAAVKRLSLAASEKTTGAALNFAFNKLTLRTDNPDVGTAEEDIDFASEDTFDDFKFGISLRYLGEALERIATPNAILRLNGQLDPLLMYGTGSDATHGDVFVVMPMRL